MTFQGLEMTILKFHDFSRFSERYENKPYSWGSGDDVTLPPSGGIDEVTTSTVIYIIQK